MVPAEAAEGAALALLLQTGAGFLRCTHKRWMRGAEDEWIVSTRGQMQGEKGQGRGAVQIGGVEGGEFSCSPPGGGAAASVSYPPLTPPTNYAR